MNKIKVCEVGSVREIYIKDIKAGDIIQVFQANSLRLDIHKVIDIYKSEVNNKRIFRCTKMTLNEKRDLIEDWETVFIDEKDILSMYNEIKRG